MSCLAQQMYSIDSTEILNYSPHEIIFIFSLISSFQRPNPILIDMFGALIDLIYFFSLVWSEVTTSITNVHFELKAKLFANKIHINYEKLERKRCENLQNLNFPPSNFAHIVCIKKCFIVSLASFQFCCVRLLLPLVNK